MNATEAARVLEELRKGIPPPGFIEHFTVGREEELNKLRGHLEGTPISALLLKANYGAGKSHLLRLIQERALRLGYAVSYVTLDSSGGVRFNRLDQVMGAVLREMRVASNPGKGLDALFDLLTDVCERQRTGGAQHAFWRSVTNSWRWDFSEELGSPGLFVALRAWATQDKNARDLVRDWLYNPEAYQSQRKRLYEGLVSDLRSHFRDARRESQFYAEATFSFREDGYRRAWDSLNDLDALAKGAGLRGLVILFDEFEDVLTNLKNIKYQESAFWNLFLFFNGKRFNGSTFYAVTPNFVEKCKTRLLSKGALDFDYTRFDTLPTFSMSPLEERDLLKLAKRIGQAHAVAFGYTAEEALGQSISAMVRAAARSPVQDRARHTIRSVVLALDQWLEDR